MVFLYNDNMNIFNGKDHAKSLEQKIKNNIFTLNPFNKLAIVQVGENPASQKYINLKENTCNRLGIRTIVNFIGEGESDENIYSRVRQIFNDKQVGGGIIQLPLPRKSLNGVLNLIPPGKDIDLISSKSLKQYYEGDFSKLSPVVRSLQYFLAVNELNTQNLKVVIIGNGSLVGRPISYFLLKNGAKVTVLDDTAVAQNKLFDNKTQEKTSIIKEAFLGDGIPVVFDQIDYKKNYEYGTFLDCDLLVLSAGIPRLIKGVDIKDNCAVVDYGSAVLENKTVGDLDLDSEINHLGIVSPSPGGMGPLVVRFLIMNFIGI